MTRLTSIKARLERATPGPWWLGYWSDQCHIHHKDENGKFTPFHPGREECKYEYTRITDNEHFADTVCAPQENVQIIDHAGCNAQLIAHAPQDLRDLLAALECALNALRIFSLEVPESINATELQTEMTKAAKRTLDEIDRILSGEGE